MITGIPEQIRAEYMEYQRLEGKLYRLLDKLTNYGKECDCRNPERIALRDEESMVEYCALCGGYTEKGD